MKVCIVLLVALAFVHSAPVADGEKPTKTVFTTKYDNIDVDEILKSKRLRVNYFECLMDRKPCTAEGNELRKALPLAIQSKCDGCSEKQKVGAEKVLRWVYENEQERFKELEKKYDPEGKYRKAYAPEIKEKYGVDV